jgi:uncharacterized protein (TIGR02117 family)
LVTCRCSWRSRFLLLPYLLVLATALSTMLVGCSTLPKTLPNAQSPETVVYVVDRDWHTDIALPVNMLGGEMALLAQDFPGATYVSIGFGDRNYLLDPNTDILDMLRALFPGRAAILVTGLRVTPAAAFGAGNVVTLAVSKKGLEDLQAFIAGDLTHDPDGRPARLANGPYPGSLFYGTDATYDAFHTCNTWVAEALAAAGLPVGPTFMVFAGQVMTAARSVALRQGTLSR